MIALYLDDRQAVLPEKASFKFVRENPYFTKSASYTYDVVLPLSGCSVNQIIFKHINRQDVTKADYTFKARLIVNNKCVLDGTAVIKSVTDKDVKVQLLAGNSEFNFYTKCSEVYIDEINYGFTIQPVHQFDVPTAFSKYFTMGHTFFPVYNESAGKVYNELACTYINGREGFQYYGSVYYSKCVHLNLNWLFSKIMRHLGYSFSYDLNSGIDFERMYIANSTVTTVYNEVLPHWSVNELLEQLEKFLGVVFVVEEGTKNIEMISTNKYIDKYPVTYLSEVLDEYNVDIEEETENALDLANIGYSWEENSDTKYLKLNEDAISQIKKSIYDTYDELVTAYNSDQEWNRARKIYEAAGRQYIEVDNGNGKKLKEVNQFRNLYRNTEKKDLDVELNIVPCPMTQITVKVYRGGSLIDSNFLYSFDVDIPSVPGHESETGRGIEPTVASIIEGEAYKPYKPDKLYLYYWDGQMQTFTSGDRSHQFPMPYIDSDIIKEKYGRSLPERSFRIVGPAGQVNIGNSVYEKVWKINQVTKEVKKFISSEIYSPNGVFVIKNKRYLCHKIQVNVANNGIDKLQEFTGYQVTEGN